MSGFNLPPGCTVGMIERHFAAESPCNICHRWSEHADPTQECKCGECPKCGAFGDRACYEGGTCGGIGGPVPTHAAATCEVCIPPKGDCPKHGAYLLADGCVSCMAEDLGYPQFTKHEIEARAYFASLSGQDPERWDVVHRPVPKVGYDFASPEDRVFGQCWTDADGRWAQEPLGKQPVLLAWKGPK